MIKTTKNPLCLFINVSFKREIFYCYHPDLGSPLSPALNRPLKVWSLRQKRMEKAINVLHVSHSSVSHVAPTRTEQRSIQTSPSALWEKSKGLLSLSLIWSDSGLMSLKSASVCFKVIIYIWAVRGNWSRSGFWVLNSEGSDLRNKVRGIGELYISPDSVLSFPDFSCDAVHFLTDPKLKQTLPT